MSIVDPVCSLCTTHPHIHARPAVGHYVDRWGHVYYLCQWHLPGLIRFAQQRPGRGTARAWGGILCLDTPDDPHRR